MAAARGEWRLPRQLLLAIVLLSAFLIGPLVLVSQLAAHIKGPDDHCRRTKSIDNHPIDLAAVATPSADPSATAAEPSPIPAKKNAPAPAPAAAPPRQPEDSRDEQSGITRKVSLAMREGQWTSLAFGRELTIKRLDIWFHADKKLPKPERRIRLDVGIFRRTDDARITPSVIHANARAFGTAVRLRVCVERTQEGVAHAGTYTGTISFFDYRVAEVSVPITITLSYPFWPWPSLAFYFVVLAGIPYVWALRRDKKEDVVFLSMAGLREIGAWLRTWKGLVSVFAGGVGALTAFVATYMTSPDWGSGIPQLLGLIGAMFTGFVTAGTALHVASGVAASSSRGQASPGQADERGDDGF